MQSHMPLPHALNALHAGGAGREREPGEPLPAACHACAPAGGFARPAAAAAQAEPSDGLTSREVLKVLGARVGASPSMSHSPGTSGAASAASHAQQQPQPQPQQGGACGPAGASALSLGLQASPPSPPRLGALQLHTTLHAHPAASAAELAAFRPPSRGACGYVLPFESPDGGDGACAPSSPSSPSSAWGGGLGAGGPQQQAPLSSSPPFGAAHLPPRAAPPQCALPLAWSPQQHALAQRQRAGDEGQQGQPFYAGWPPQPHLIGPAGGQVGGCRQLVRHASAPLLHLGAHPDVRGALGCGGSSCGLAPFSLPPALGLGGLGLELTPDGRDGEGRLVAAPRPMHALGGCGYGGLGGGALFASAPRQLGFARGSGSPHQPPSAA
ncbi:hypothetical protein T492DRAFT_910988, partial [Pavlovales sp. CCMP2436]